MNSHQSPLASFITQLENLPDPGQQEQRLLHKDAPGVPPPPPPGESTRARTCVRLILSLSLMLACHGGSSASGDSSTDSGSQTGSSSDTTTGKSCPSIGASSSTVSGTTPHGAFSSTGTWYTVTYPLECSGSYNVYIVEDADAFQASVTTEGDASNFSGDYLFLALFPGETPLGVEFEVTFGFFHGGEVIAGYGVVTLGQIDEFPEEEGNAFMTGIVTIDSLGVSLHGEFSAPFCIVLADLCV